MDVAEWLRNLGLEQYAAAFRKTAVAAEFQHVSLLGTSKSLGSSLSGIDAVYSKQ
jgi:hypothetical protein